MGELYCQIIGELYCQVIGELYCQIIGELYCQVIGELYCQVIGELYCPDSAAAVISRFNFTAVSLQMTVISRTTLLGCRVTVRASGRSRVGSPGRLRASRC